MTFPEETPLPIGQWVERQLNGRRQSRTHFVESLIMDRAVMRCGRQMDLSATNGDLTVVDQIGHPCHQCHGESGIVGVHSHQPSQEAPSG